MTEREKQLAKERKQRYFDKKYEEAPYVECACGCGGKLKSVDKYGRPKKYIHGHHGRKYKDPRQHKREWNARNKGRHYESKVKRGRKLKVKLIEMYGGKCASCGYEYNGSNASAFDFHHREPGTVSFRLTTQFLVNYAWDKVLEEAKKCVMICTNCHREHHYNNNQLSDKPTAIKKRERVFRLKEELLKKQGARCEDCGLEYDGDNITVFDFHHKNPEEKSFPINQLTFNNRSIASIKKEADKCVILCSRCHRIHHNGV